MLIILAAPRSVAFVAPCGFIGAARPRLHPCVFFAAFFLFGKLSSRSCLSFLLFRRIESPTTGADGRVTALAGSAESNDDVTPGGDGEEPQDNLWNLLNDANV